LTMEVSLSPNTYSQASKVRNFYQTFLERAQLLPGVRSAALTTLLPLSGDDNELPFWVSGRPKPATIEQADYAMFYCASTRYFQTMGIRLLRGRVFEDSDSQTAGLVVMIDDQLASQMFKGEDPIGKRIRFDLEGIDQEREIIGVVGHVKQVGLDSDEQYKVQMQIYMPYQQIPDQFMTAAASGMTLAVRTVSDPSGMAAAIRSEVSAIDRNQPIYNLKMMEELAASSIAQRRLSMLLFGGFAAVALLLAAVGLYGVVSFWVNQRTHEIGIRMALGATGGEVLRLVVGQGLRLALIGAGVGLAGSFLLTRLVASFLYRVSLDDPVTFAAVSALLTAVAFLASYVPARRATRVDPML